MSLESVLKNCLTSLGDEERAHKGDLLKANLKKNQQRFEKLLFTYSFEGESSALWDTLKGDGQTASAARREYFEKHKKHLAHRYLEMLCDLYDL